MKKQIISLKNLADLSVYKRRIANAFTEDGKEAADAIRAILDELENVEVEVDSAMLVERIKEVLEGEGLNNKQNAEVEKAVAEAVAKRAQAFTETGKKELPAKVKNQISAAILRSYKESVKDAVNGVLTKNAITGLTFEDVVDYAVVDGWGDANPLFKRLYKTMYNKFFYTAQELSDARILAKGWPRGAQAAAEKQIQTIEATGKRFETAYVYKRQQADLDALDDIEAAGETANFARKINEELDRQIVNTIVLAILVGDTINEAGERVTSFETLNKEQTDIFTNVYSIPAATFDANPLAEVRKLSDTVRNPYGYYKMAVMNTATLTALAQFKYAEGGTVDFRSKEEIAARIGVDEIFVTDILSLDGAPRVEVIIPEEYWYREKGAVAVTYMQWEKNRNNHQHERNIGGAIHGLHSTAVLKVTD